MPMRTDCRHYESRTYPSGDTVRKCRLDLAPEAPWRCPADCPRYERRTADVGWNYGSLREAAEPEPDPVESSADISALLDEAEDIVNAAGRDIVAEIDAKQRRKGGIGRLKPKRRKKR
jgi:hypothetical protein